MTVQSLKEPDSQFAGVSAPVTGGSSLGLMLKNSAATLARLGSGWLLVVVVPPFLTRHLPKATFAVWMLILQFAAYVTLVQGGIELSVSRYVARADHIGEKEHIREILGAAVLLLASFGLILIMSSAGASWKFAWLFPEVPANLVNDARYALLIVAVCYSVNLPFSVLSGMFQGTQKFEVTAIAVSLGKFVTAAGIIGVAMHGGSLIFMACWTAVGPMFQSLLMFVWWRRVSTFVPHRPNLDSVREFLQFCVSILIVQFTMVLINGLDLPIVAAFDFGATGYYAAAAAAAGVFATPSTAIVATFLPVASGIVATRRPEDVGVVLTRVTRYATALLCTIAFPLLVFMYPMLKLWIGAAYAQHTLVLALTLLLAQFVRLTLWPYSIVGFSAGQQGGMLASPVLEGIVNLTVSLIGVHIWGAWGVALGTLVGALVGILVHFLVSMPATDAVHIQRKVLLAEGIIKPTAISLPASALGIFIASVSDSLILGIAGWLTLLLGIAASHFWFTLSAAERLELLEILARYTARFSLFARPAKQSF